MKKIKNMRHLRAEKKKLRNRQDELEKNFGHDLSELKETLQPGKVATFAFRSWMDKKTNEFANRKSILQSIFSYGTSLIAKRFAQKAGERFNTMFKRS